MNEKLRLLLTQGCSLKIEVLNFWSIRLTHEENNRSYYDWFFTTGTLMRHTYERIGIFTDPEELGVYVLKQLTKKI